MNTWYIFNASTDRVWTHSLASCGERCFAVDFDGEYRPDHFGYKARSRAEAQAASLRQTESGEIVVVDREELFKRKSIADRSWAHLREQPSPAQRRRQEARAEAETRSVLRATMSLAPRRLDVPVVAI